jgi:hypothetical protein
MKWKGRRESKNVKKLSKDDIANVITKEDFKKGMKDSVKRTAMNSEVLKSKDLKRAKDWQTDIINKYNYTEGEQRSNARRLAQLKDTAKPQHLIPASRKPRLKKK